MPTTKEIADELVALCRRGRNLEVIERLMSGDVVSVEAIGDDTMPAVMNGREAVRGKNEWWFENHVVHHASVRGPFPNNERFAVIFDFEVTPKAGPMAGRRMRMEEVALYSVVNGKVAREEFFYDMGGASSLPLSKAKKTAPKTPKATRKSAGARAKAGARKAKSKARGRVRAGARKAKARKK